MRKVVDSNMLQSEALRTYLYNSGKNYAVLTDYVAMEAYKGDDPSSIHRRMEVLATRPKQVIVLKGTQSICGLRGRASGLQRRMIDERQTRTFERYCRDLHDARNGNTKIQEQLLNHAREADAQMHRVLADATTIPEVLDGVAETYTEAELRLLRTRAAFTEEIARKLVRNIARTAKRIFDDHPQVKTFPRQAELLNTFIFRFALCAHLWAVDWISVGGPQRAKPERLRNDMVDISFATYGTFFDGLLTEDRKAAAIHRDACQLLRVLQQAATASTVR